MSTNTSKYGILNKKVVPINLRAEIDSEMADEGLYGMVVKILEERENNWFLIETEYDYKGYVHETNMVIDDEVALDWKEKAKSVIIHSIVDVMPEASYKGNIIQVLTRGATVINTANTKDNWTQIQLISGIKGWVRSNFIKKKVELGSELDKSSLRKDLVDTALSYLGTQYRWGGRSPLGLDCSGLCSMSYLLNGIVIYRDAVLKDEYLKEIDLEDVKAGDLIFFPGHVAMYIGNDRYVHSSSSINGVNINSLNPIHSDYRETLAKTITGVGTIFK